ncbi:MAG: polysaccharide biosynthesis protein [bacterium]
MINIIWIDRIPTLARRLIILFFDLTSVSASLVLAFSLRFEGRLSAEETRQMWQLLLLLAPLRMSFLYGYGLYRGMWRYASIDDLMTIIRAVSLSALISIACYWFLYGFDGMARSVFIIDWALAVLLVGGSRFFVRAMLANSPQLKGGTRVLIVGAGDTGESLLREILFKPSEIDVIGLVDDNPLKHHMRIHGVPVLGTHHHLAVLVKRHSIAEILIALPSASGPVLREIVSQCQEVKVRFRRVPSVKELLEGNVTVSHLREVQLEDLLGRAPVNLDNQNLAAFLQDKIVMVTGAGGSIGSELCRQIAHCKPRLLLMMDQAENGLYSVDQDFLRSNTDVERRLIIADVTDARRLQEVFTKYHPQLIFHAAAHKHVPMMELNKKEALKNNVLGTRLLAETAQAYAALKMVMISTDKAVNPTSVMGASKRLAEMLLQRLARTSRTAFVTVRFGNVLGSDGSVVPLFKKQLTAGGPLTVTHPDIERYFMTIPEAVQLVLQAGAMGQGGEIFVLDMGKPVKIVDLARNLITLAGYKPEDVGIKFVGLRPGEKLYEELWRSEEKVHPTMHSKIMVAQTDVAWPELNGALDELMHVLHHGDDEATVELLQRLVPTFHPPEHNRREKAHRPCSGASPV